MELKIIQGNVSEEILELYVKSFRLKPWNETWTFDMAGMRINDYLQNPMALGYEARQDGNIVGFLMGYIISYLGVKEFHIQDFVISVDFSRMGLGTKMLALVQQDVKRRGIENINLITLKDPRTEGFYNKNGYETDSNLVFMNKKI
ncbi:acetyltransferase [Clostridium sp. ASBs410]|jgi:ribosomal protein S18 acetylase RimI-like enzyme|nr:acetyltransferase [Clostridium sp. ASBs410]